MKTPSTYSQLLYITYSNVNYIYYVVHCIPNTRLSYRVEVCAFACPGLPSPFPISHPLSSLVSIDLISFVRLCFE